MPDVDLRLVRKGHNQPLPALIQQARVSAELAKAKARPLEEEGGWTPADTEALVANTNLLDTDASRQADDTEGARILTKTEVEWRGEAKKFIRRLRNALPRVLRENPGIDVRPEAFESGRLRDSTPKILQYLTEIRPHVIRLDGPLARYFRGTAASAKLDEVKTGLESADATQEATLKMLPSGTQKLYELKGRVLEQIEDLNRAGRSAFDGNATEMAAFNKDILLRARRSKPKKEPKDA